MFSEDVVWMVEEISKTLLDWKLKEAFLEERHEYEDPDEYEDRAKYCGLVFQKGKQQRIVWVSQDPEMNGPGWLKIGPALQVNSNSSQD